MMKSDLTIDTLQREAKTFADLESHHEEPSLYGITDGKAVGTYLELKFKAYLKALYNYEMGNVALGIDFPSLEVDMKVTSVRQPQSSSPFRSARQKIFGLGYNLLIFVYEKIDFYSTQSSQLNIVHTIFVQKEKTADYQMTRGILGILSNNGNRDDLIAFMLERNLPVDDIEVERIADEILVKPPTQGYLTISNALQWRLQYSRVIQEAGQINGIFKIR
ncbi:restriction endonuclease [Aphanothece hegewaldii CCALA 016]|uniref:Restriction endonuclease n=1 Tax=Aphanothece hegewaldii CCALA 016 TaxID=2107694 RepID=A0A2T1LRC0_9CHRO|nr:restriction endonuclease [Aphanothece hegewaldii]PSF31163.1 restriction endonuclease [Aphanothece hegewaldii CCALA 016]